MRGLTNCVAYLIKAAHQAPSADNMQPWYFSWKGEVLTIGFANDRMRQPLMDQNALGTLLSMGAVLENLDQAALAAGISLEYMNAFSPEAGIYARIRVPKVESDIPGEAWEHPLFHRHTNRGAYTSEPLPADLLKEVSRCSLGDTQIKLLNDSAARIALVRLTRRASEMRFRNQRIHEWFISSLRWGKEATERGTGLDVASLALPWGGRALLRAIGPWPRLRTANRAGAYRVLAALETFPLKRAPALAMILAPEGGTGPLTAGRTLERAWILLNKAGVAVQPFFVLADQLDRQQKGMLPKTLAPAAQRLEEDTSRVMGSHKLRLMMILRLGYPRRPAVRSFRLPVESVTLMKQ